MLPARLLVALCATPAVVGALVGIAFLRLPTLLYALLMVAGVWLAILVAAGISTHVDEHRTPFGLTYPLHLTALTTYTITVAATLAVASTWSLAAVAEERTCTVTARTHDEVVPAMTGTPQLLPVVHLDCAGHSDSIGGAPPPLTHHTWRSWQEGDQVRVAQDPTGNLSSRAATDLHTPIRTWSVIIGLPLTVLLHVLVALTLQHDRRHRTTT